MLLVLAVGLAVRLGMDWAAMDSHSGEVLAGKQIQLKALEIQTAPLRGLDKRVDKTREEMQAFYKKRIPPDYSSISSRIGDLAVTSGVRLTRVQYTQGPPGSDLTEISMDAGISGDYPAIMHFVNSMERDRSFSSFAPCRSPASKAAWSIFACASPHGCAPPTCGQRPADATPHDRPTCARIVRCRKEGE